MVAAGAGTGKTKTLAHRVARPILAGADPRRLLLLTFTRRAALEMTRRTQQILVSSRPGRPVRGAETILLPWSGTFHSIGSRLLRRHAAALSLDPAFTVLDRCGALLVMSDAIYFGARLRLAELAARHGIPASYDNRQIVDAGGLMSYGPNTNDMLRRAVLYVDKILKGAKPSNRTADQIRVGHQSEDRQRVGLTVARSILAQADEVIE